MIDALLAAAHPGDTVVLKPGVYHERLVTHAPGVTILAKGVTLVVSGPWRSPAENVSTGPSHRSHRKPVTGVTGFIFFVRCMLASHHVGAAA